MISLTCFLISKMKNKFIKKLTINCHVIIDFFAHPTGGAELYSL